jgi:hypothetical protein
MLRRTRFRLTLAIALGLAGVAACSPEHVAGPSSSTNWSPLPFNLFDSDPDLVICPAGEPQSATALIGPLGGVLAAGNTQVVIPANAVLSPTTFNLSVPASKYVEIEVTTDASEHYVFAQPVLVTIDYSRCSRSNLLRGPLSAWNIDPETKALLERMISVDNKLTQTVTFTTLHFSGYAVAD